MKFILIWPVVNLQNLCCWIFQQLKCNVQWNTNVWRFMILCLWNHTGAAPVHNIYDSTSWRLWQSPIVCHHIYADDTQAYIGFSSLTASETLEHLPNCLSHIQLWQKTFWNWTLTKRSLFSLAKEHERNSFPSPPTQSYGWVTVPHRCGEKPRCLFGLRIVTFQALNLGLLTSCSLIVVDD